MGPCNEVRHERISTRGLRAVAGNALRDRRALDDVDGPPERRGEALPAGGAGFRRRRIRRAGGRDRRGARDVHRHARAALAALPAPGGRPHPAGADVRARPADGTGGRAGGAGHTLRALLQPRHVLGGRVRAGSGVAARGRVAREGPGPVLRQLLPHPVVAGRAVRREGHRLVARQRRRTRAARRHAVGALHAGGEGGPRGAPRHVQLRHHELPERHGASGFLGGRGRRAGLPRAARRRRQASRGSASSPGTATTGTASGRSGGSRRGRERTTG